MVRIAPFAHTYWSGIYKSLLLAHDEEPSIFSELLGIPAYRVLFGEDDEACLEAEISTRGFPYIGFCFIRLPKHKIQQETKGTRCEELKKFLAEYRGWTEGTEENRPRRSEVFLTLSQEYPLMVKGEFESFKHLDRFFQRIRSNTADVSTIIGFNKDAFDKQSEEKVQFSVLCKIKESPGSGHAAEIKKELENRFNGIADAHSGVNVFSRGYFWDLICHFKTQDVSKQFDIMTQDMAGIKEIHRAITIPYFQVEEEPPPDQDADSKPVKSSAPQKSRDIENFNMEKYFEYLETTLTSLESFRRVTTENMPEKDLFSEKSQGETDSFFFRSPSYDLLNMRLYNLCFDVEYFYSYIKRIESAWDVEHLGPIDTFLQLEKLTRSAITFLKKAIIYYNKNLRAENWFETELSRKAEELVAPLAEELMDKRENATYNQMGEDILMYLGGMNDTNLKKMKRELSERQKTVLSRYQDKFEVEVNEDLIKNLSKDLHKLTDWMDTGVFAGSFSGSVTGNGDEFFLTESNKSREDKIKDIWNLYRLAEKRIHIIKKILSSIRTHFNERLESRQIVTVSEPYIRFGQGAEIADQACLSANALFVDYLGEIGRCWKGLVLPSFENDFEISTISRTLFLPVDIKLQTHDKLPLLAHEAGHFILGLLLERGETKTADNASKTDKEKGGEKEDEKTIDFAKARA